MAAAVGDEVGDRADLDAVALGEGDEVGEAGHRPVLVHDLADHAGGVEAGEAGDVDRRLGMAGADQHAAVAGAQREDVAGRGDVLRPRARVDGDGDGAGAVVGGDAGGHALARLDRDGEGGLVARGVGLRHQRQAERVEPLAGQREADQAAAVGGHEVDRVGRRHLGGDDEVALVLAILVVDEDEHPAVAGVVDDLLDRGDRVGIVVRRERGHAAIRSVRRAGYRRAGGKARAGCAGGDGRARLAAVQTVFSPLHARHAGNVELNSGAIVPAFELPRRAEMVRARVAEVGLGAIVPPEEHDLATARRVHAVDYIEFLPRAWPMWAAAGREGSAMPFVWPVPGLRADRPPEDIDGLLGFYTMDAGATFVEGPGRRSRRATTWR